MGNKKSVFEKIPQWAWVLISFCVALLVWFLLSIGPKTGRSFPFVPKIIAVFLTLMLLGGWMLNEMADFMTKLWNNFSLYIG